MMRYLEDREGEVMICRHILDEDELPWRSSKAGLEFFSALSVILIRPCCVSRVKLDIFKVVLMIVC